MTQIEKIKAEIERLIQKEELYLSADNINNDERKRLIEKYKDLLSFIESLEKEQEVDLEKELEKVTEHWSIEPEYGALCNERKKSVVDMDDVMSVARHFYELGLNAKTDAPKIKGWVARDMNGELYLHNDKPLRTTTMWNSSTYIAISADMFPELRFEDKPIEVELTISRVVKTE